MERTKDINNIAGDKQTLIIRLFQELAVMAYNFSW